VHTASARNQLLLTPTGASACPGHKYRMLAICHGIRGSRWRVAVGAAGGRAHWRRGAPPAEGYGAAAPPGQQARMRRTICTRLALARTSMKMGARFAGARSALGGKGPVHWPSPPYTSLSSPGHSMAWHGTPSCSEGPLRTGVICIHPLARLRLVSEVTEYKSPWHITSTA
jgi:hypothetical protein